MPTWTKKQKEYGLNANHRWNVKLGAVRSGKTFQDKEDIIPRRIRERAGKDGLVFIIGVTEATVERNVLRPMRDKFGGNLVGTINKNKVWLFGEECYCLGAEKINQVAKIQGASIKYLYGDEVVKWNKEVFDMIKSRLDQSYSCADLTGNPEQKTHWFKEFIESDADIYLQHYTIDDNDFLSIEFKENLKKEYEGTVLYNRYILGQWCNAEGLIYKRFADNPQKYKWTKKKENGEYDLPQGYTIIGIDYGGNKSGQAFVCTRISYDFKYVIALGSEKHMGDIDPDKLEQLQIEFAKKMMYKYNCDIDYMLPDNEEVVLIRGLRRAVETNNLNTLVRGCVKEPINDRIDCGRTMIAYDIFYYIEEECDTLVEAISSALWDSEKNEDTRLDDFTTDIDTIDAWEYSWCKFIRKINDMIERKRSDNIC